MRSRRVSVITALSALVLSSVVAVGSGSAGAAAGTCKGTLKIGITYPDLSGVNQAFENAGGQQQSGAGNIPRNDVAEKYSDVLVDAMNKDKAFGGCTIEPVYYAFSSSTPDKYLDFTQQECLHFTQDEKVFAIIAGAQENAILVECVARAKVPLISQGTGPGAVWTNADFKKYQGYLYQPATMSMDRTATLIDLLFKNGTLKKSSKIAVMAVDAPQSTAILNGSYLPALKKHGVKDPLVIRPTFPVTNAGTYILKMKDAGITDVIDVPSGASLIFGLTAEAQTQNFLPHYYFTAADAPSIAAFAYPKAMEGAVIMSWSAAISPDDAEIPENTATKHCADVYKGEAPPQGGNFGALTARPPYASCSSLDFLAQALDHAPAATVDGFRKGVEALASFEVAGAYGPSKLGPGRYDGATTVRLMTFDPDRKAFLGSGPTTDVPARQG
jgi:Periplasmic binding protein